MGLPRDRNTHRNFLRTETLYEVGRPTHMHPTKDLLAFHTQKFGAFHQNHRTRHQITLLISRPRCRFFYIENLGVDTLTAFLTRGMASQVSFTVSQASQEASQASPASQASQASQAVSQVPMSQAQASQAFPIAPAWRARPGCPTHLRAHLERLVNGSPPTWLREPTTDEVFENIIEAERRLRVFSLTEGFNIVRTVGGTKRVSGSTF